MDESDKLLKRADKFLTASAIFWMLQFSGFFITGISLLFNPDSTFDPTLSFYWVGIILSLLAGITALILFSKSRKIKPTSKSLQGIWLSIIVLALTIIPLVQALLFGLGVLVDSLSN